MRGPYSEYAAPPVYIYPATQKPRIRFSRTELFQLLVAILALSGAFTILFVGSPLSGFRLNLGEILTVYFPASILAVGTGVGLHEIMHKVVAQRYGYWAEFRYNPQGLLFAIILAAAIGFLYGAPGATWISGPVTRRQNGWISAAGPATNIAITSVLMASFFALGPIQSEFEAVLIAYLLTAALVNAILGAFNLLPIMPLDGAKIWAWNKAVYAGFAAIAVALLILTYSRAV
jgi:Zn-dependent protease